MPCRSAPKICSCAIADSFIHVNGCISPVRKRPNTRCMIAIQSKQGQDGKPSSSLSAPAWENLTLIHDWDCTSCTAGDHTRRKAWNHSWGKAWNHSWGEAQDSRIACEQMMSAKRGNTFASHAHAFMAVINSDCIGNLSWRQRDERVFGKFLVCADSICTSYAHDGCTFLLLQQNCFVPAENDQHHL